MESVCGSDFTTERYHVSPKRVAYSRPTTTAETSDTFNALYKWQQTHRTLKTCTSFSLFHVILTKNRCIFGCCCWRAGVKGERQSFPHKQSVSGLREDKDSGRSSQAGVSAFMSSPHCSDTVGWVTGRTFGGWKTCANYPQKGSL